MATFKKGDQVYAVKSWDSLGTFSVDRWTITSWGRKQGTAIREENGKPIAERIYIEQVGRLECVSWSPFLFPVDGTDIEAEVLTIAAAFISKEQQHPCNTKKVYAPRVAALDVLRAELMEKLRREKGYQHAPSSW